MKLDSKNINMTIDLFYQMECPSESVLVELINSNTFARLKKIHQGGASYLVSHARCGSRFDHSVGVMLLIRRLGGSLEEQIAGLLHDISHTAFSHVVDQVFDNKKEDFHEEKKEWFLNYSDIPKILNKYNYDAEMIFNEKNWSILEQPLPYLCADRIDYTLRDLHGIGEISLAEIKFFLESICIIDNKIVLSSVEAAEWFAQAFYKLVTDVFMSPLEIYANNHLASILKKAVQEGIITVEDMLLKDDEFIIEKIEKSGNREHISNLQLLNHTLEVTVDDQEFDYRGFSKPRFVDPLILIDEQVAKASTISADIEKYRIKIIDKSKSGVFVKRGPHKSIRTAE